MKELPSYKPLAKMMRMGATNEFQKLPFIADGKVFFSYAFDPHHSLTDIQTEAWKKREIFSPDVWYLFYMEVGDHPNRKRLSDYFGREGPSEDIDALYRSYWQIRLVLDHPSCKEAIKKAEYSWEWHKYEDFGIMYLPADSSKPKT